MTAQNADNESTTVSVAKQFLSDVSSLVEKLHKARTVGDQFLSYAIDVNDVGARSLRSQTRHGKRLEVSAHKNHY